jgi:hypothetical protein
MRKIVIELEFNGLRDNAFRVVDSLLDAGVIQDLINEQARDLELKLHVTHAMTNVPDR